MASQRKEGGISWTDETWNPVRGCSRVSEGCRNCYAERTAARFAGRTTRYAAGYVNIDQPFYGFVRITNGHPQWTGKVELVEKHLEDPLHWKTPRRVFVNSMSDLFHEDLDVLDVLRIVCVIQEAEQHDFQVLTKRADRMAFLVPWMRQALAQDYERWNGGRFRWPIPNMWLGVSVEDRENKRRIDVLRKTPAAIRFLSIEPLIEDIGELDLAGIHWVIVGGESGPHARPFDIQWAYSIVRQCVDAGVPCFVKQLGAVPVDSRWMYGVTALEDKRAIAAGRALGLATPPNLLLLKDRKGGDWDEWPEDLRVREFPEARA